MTRSPEKKPTLTKLKLKVETLEVKNSPDPCDPRNDDEPVWGLIASVADV